MSDPVSTPSAGKQDPVSQSSPKAPPTEPDLATLSFPIKHPGLEFVRAVTERKNFRERQAALRARGVTLKEGPELECTYRYTDEVPSAIIFHHTGSETVAGAFKALKQRGLSYHYVVGKQGEVYECVRPERTAYHAGDCNPWSIGIALVGGLDPTGRYTEAQLKATRELTVQLIKEHPEIEVLIGHKHVSPGRKPDPVGLNLDKFADSVNASLRRERLNQKVFGPSSKAADEWAARSDEGNDQNR